MSRVHEITRAFGGDWHGNYGAVPWPGHSKADRGMTVKDAEGDDGISFFSLGLDR